MIIQMLQHPDIIELRIVFSKMKKNYPIIMILLLLSLLCICIYMYWFPTLFFQKRDYQSFTELLEDSHKRTLISNCISLGAIVIAKIVLRYIDFYGKKVFKKETHISYSVQLSRCILLSQWIWNGALIASILSVLTSIANVIK